jgi:hypothetical protein
VINGYLSSLELPDGTTILSSSDTGTCTNFPPGIEELSASYGGIDTPYMKEAMDDLLRIF